MLPQIRKVGQPKGTGTGGKGAPVAGTGAARGGNLADAIGIDVGPRVDPLRRSRGATRAAVGVDLAAGLLRDGSQTRSRGRQDVAGEPGPGRGQEGGRRGGRGPAGGRRGLGGGGEGEYEDEDGGAAVDDAFHGRALFPAARGRGLPDRGGAASGKSRTPRGAGTSPSPARNIM